MKRPLIEPRRGWLSQWAVGNPAAGSDPVPPVLARLMLRAQSGEPLGRADVNRLAKALRRTSVAALKRELRTLQRTAGRSTGRTARKAVGAGGRPVRGRGGRR